MTYILEAGAVPAGAVPLVPGGAGGIIGTPGGSVGEGEGQQALIFCIDISGSMGNRKPNIANPMRAAKRIITRFEHVRTAVQNQITQIAKTSPNTKVGIVLFNDSVKIIGDCVTSYDNIPDPQFFSNFDVILKREFAFFILFLVSNELWKRSKS